MQSGFIDILAEDGAGRLVVVELKVGDAPADVIAQILGYMGDLQNEEGHEIAGIVIAEDFSIRLRSAARLVGLRLVIYRYQFNFADA